MHSNIEEKPNILFIIIDALRARNLGCYGYSKPTSPNINNLAKDGVKFEKAYSCAITTYPSLTTIFSGKYPLSHGIIKHELTPKHQDIEKLDETRTVFLPEILRSEGYATLAVDWLGRWLKRGYQFYSGILSPKRMRLYALAKTLFRFKKLTPYLTHTKLIDHAKNVTDKAISLIKRVHKKRFFLSVHYWDAHIPYNPPKRYAERFINYDYGNNKRIEEILSQYRPKYARYLQNRLMSSVKSAKEVLARYDGAIAFVDHELGRLINSLENYGISEETFVVLTSDHGESLTEHGINFCHHGLYDVTIHVPLIFKYSVFPRNRKIGGFIQHHDIVPTILDVLGIKMRRHVFDGKSVVPLIYGELEQLRTAIYAEEADTQHKRAIRTRDYKYIYALTEEDALCKHCGVIHGGMEELYDLNGDPEETNNVTEKNSDQANMLREKLFEFVKFLESKRSIKETKASRYYSSEEEKTIKERLRKLGYL